MFQHTKLPIQIQTFTRSTFPQFFLCDQTGPYFTFNCYLSNLITFLSTESHKNRFNQKKTNPKFQKLTSSSLPHLSQKPNRGVEEIEQQNKPPQPRHKVKNFLYWECNWNKKNHENFGFLNKELVIWMNKKQWKLNSFCIEIIYRKEEKKIKKGKKNIVIRK